METVGFKTVGFKTVGFKTVGNKIVGYNNWAAIKKSATVTERLETENCDNKTVQPINGPTTKQTVIERSYAQRPLEGYKTMLIFVCKLNNIFCV